MNHARKIAIVYDWIDSWGGVERILLILHSLFPGAPFYTSYFDQGKARWAKNLSVRSSFIQHFPSGIKSSRAFSFPFYPFAFESFNFSHYDVVISVSSSFAKSVITSPHTLHLCYLLTPTRYLWVYPELYLSPFSRSAFNPYLRYIKNWDYQAAQRPDVLATLSHHVSSRIKQYYNRSSQIIPPPFDTVYWKKIKDLASTTPVLITEKLRGYYLLVSRLEPYKKVDLAIAVFNRLKDKLVIVGKGSQERALKEISNPNIQFISELSDLQLARLYQQAKALIVPQEEDFGYVALEAQFMGCPVIAYRKSGVSEIVTSGKSALFFENQSPLALREALERFNEISYNLKEKTVQYGEELCKFYDFSVFKKRLLDLLG